MKIFGRKANSTPKSNTYLIPLVTIGISILSCLYNGRVSFLEVFMVIGGLTWLRLKYLNSMKILTGKVPRLEKLNFGDRRDIILTTLNSKIILP